MISRRVNLFFVWAWFFVGCDANSVSFTPTSVLVPIQSIQLSSSAQGDGGQVLAECQSHDCMIDVMDGDERSILSQTNAVLAGTYQYMHIQFCSAGERSFNAKFLGEFDIGGIEYYSHANDAFKEKAGSEDPQYVTVSFNECTVTYHFQTPVVVRDNQTLDVSISMDNGALSWAGIQVIPFNQGRCLEVPHSSPRTICMKLPHIQAVTGADPSEQYYSADTMVP